WLRIPGKLKWAAILIVAGLIFRQAIVLAALTALGATLHLVGINVHLPHVRFGWPGQSVTAGTTTDTNVGPWVLQKVQGISRPALGTESLNFTFPHKVPKSIGIWPCWYAATFATVGHASATVDLNPGPAWWTPATGHYRLQVLSPPEGWGAPGARPLPAAGLGRAGGRGARPRERRDSAAPAAAAAVRSRRHRGRH